MGDVFDDDGNNFKVMAMWNRSVGVKKGLGHTTLRAMSSERDQPPRPERVLMIPT